MTDDVLFTRKGHVATITLNRPEKLNSVTPEMAELIVGMVEACNKDDEVRAVILTGAGNRAFCAGSDIRELDDYPTPWKFRNRPDYCDAIRGISKPTIAAVNGFALGGGLELALCCDIRVASDNARFGAAEIKLGWIGGGGVSFLLTHSIGPSNAALMLYTGDPVGATQAERWGLVSDVTEAGALQGKALDLAETISKRAPIAARTAKDNLRAAFTMPLEMAVRYERDLQTICMATEDAAEGRAAFKEKRDPVFKAR